MTENSLSRPKNAHFAKVIAICDSKGVTKTFQRPINYTDNPSLPQKRVHLEGHTYKVLTKSFTSAQSTSCKDNSQLPNFLPNNTIRKSLNLSGTFNSPKVLVEPIPSISSNSSASSNLLIDSDGNDFPVKIKQIKTEQRNQTITTAKCIKTPQQSISNPLVTRSFPFEQKRVVESTLSVQDSHKTLHNTLENKIKMKQGSTSNTSVISNNSFERGEMIRDNDREKLQEDHNDGVKEGQELNIQETNGNFADNQKRFDFPPLSLFNETEQVLSLGSCEQPMASENQMIEASNTNDRNSESENQSIIPNSHEDRAPISRIEFPALQSLNNDVDLINNSENTKKSTANKLKGRGLPKRKSDQVDAEKSQQPQSKTTRKSRSSTRRDANVQDGSIAIYGRTRSATRALAAQNLEREQSNISKRNDNVTLSRHLSTPTTKTTTNRLLRRKTIESCPRASLGVRERTPIAAPSRNRREPPRTPQSTRVRAQYMSTNEDSVDVKVGIRPRSNSAYPTRAAKRIQAARNFQNLASQSPVAYVNIYSSDSSDSEIEEVPNNTNIIDLSDDETETKLTRMATFRGHETICPICLGKAREREAVSTQCGHIYCKYCITKSLQSRTRQRCPMCKKTLPARNPFHLVYL